MRKGSKLTEENKLKIRNALLGRKLPKEHCENIGKSLIGKTAGIKKSAEHKRKLSIANKVYSEKNKVQFEDLYTPEPTSGCWLWTGDTLHNGYGRYGDIGKRTMRAHRYSYEKFVGPIPKGMFVCHSCDVPACVNPDHLWIGTAEQNMKDMINKGRGRWQKYKDGKKSNPNQER